MSITGRLVGNDEQAPWYNTNVSIKDDLDRIIALAQGIRTRLDNGEPLSNVLSQVRLLMNLTGKPMMVALMDLLIHGLTNVPYQGKPFTDKAYKDAGVMYMKLCGMEDVSKLDIDKIIEEPWPDRIPEKDHIITISVHEMENLEPPLKPELGDSSRIVNLKLQSERYYNRAKSILVTLRAFVYDHVSAIWVESGREKDRIDLLGPDYRLVTDKLDTLLETPVGNELLAAVGNLSSANPAKWNASALLCRNTVLKLGRVLWKVSGHNYTTRSGETLDVSNEKEKNMLLAYIDAKTTPDKQALLEGANGLVKSIYKKGSGGKRQIRHNEAQTLVVDTFRLIELLNNATELKAVNTLP